MFVVVSAGQPSVWRLDSPETLYDMTHTTGLKELPAPTTFGEVQVLIVLIATDSPLLAEWLFPLCTPHYGRWPVGLLSPMEGWQKGRQFTSRPPALGIDVLEALDLAYPGACGAWI